MSSNEAAEAVEATEPTAGAPDGTGFASDVFSIERDGGVATLWLDDPDQRNAMGFAFWADLPRAMAVLTDDDAVRAIVIAGRGRHFSVGLNLAEMGVALLQGGDSANGAGDHRPSPAARAKALHRQILTMQASINTVADCPKPVIAAIHGGCIGGAVDLVCACDIRVCSANAFFSIRETRLAIVADMGTLQRLPAIVGMGHVAELAFTGKDIDAQWAARIGLVNHVLEDPESAYAGAKAMAGDIAANSPLAVQGTKRAIQAAQARAIADGLEQIALWNASYLVSDDLTEAITAFMEKRPPSFTGE